MNPPIIIIGTGLAGYQFAREFRKLDSNTALQMITADDGSFYSKPQLSNAFAAKRTADMLVNATADAMAKQLNIDILTHTSVTQIDPIKQIIYCENKIYPYAKLILACGAGVIHPPLTGNAQKNILSVNNLTDYAHFRKQIEHKKRIVILGAGLIGSEFSNDLALAGFNVEVVAPAIAPLDLLIPATIGEKLKIALENLGVQFHLNCIANQINLLPDQTFSLELSNGKTLIADCVLSAIGLKPQISLAKTADISVNRGIVVNDFLETSQPNIYSLGDCAEVAGRVLPYITPILNCARALAQTIAGNPTAVNYPAMPITVKTPSYPIIICLPDKDCLGEWQEEITDDGIRALFYDKNKILKGFILTKALITERAQWVKNLGINITT